MAYTNPQQFFDGMTPATQFKQYHDFYPFSVSQSHDRLASPISNRQETISSQNINDHSLPPRQNSAHSDGTSVEGLSNSHFILNTQHALYPVPPQVDHTAPRFSHPSQYHYASPQSWPPYDHPLAMEIVQGLSLPFDSFPSSSPFPPPRLSPPPTTQPNGGGLSHNGRTLAGSLDPATGIFYRTPDHPRLRTAQACEKCRTRKAKCSGEHPSCKRCINRGLNCEYAKEGRVRGPNKPKVKSGAPMEDIKRGNIRGRTSSANSSAESSEQHDVPALLTSLRDQRLALAMQSPITTAGQRRNSLSLGEHRASRPRPPNLHLETSSNHYRLDGPKSDDAMFAGNVRQQRTQPSEQPPYQQRSSRRGPHHPPIGGINLMPEHSMQHCQERGATYQSFNMPSPMALMNAAYEERSSTSQRDDQKLLLTHGAFLQHHHQRRNSDRGDSISPMSQPHLVISSPSPHRSGNTSTGNSTIESMSPLTPSGTSHFPTQIMRFNSKGEHLDIDFDAFQPQPGGSGPIPGTPQVTVHLEPRWADLQRSIDPGSTRNPSTGTQSAFHGSSGSILEQDFGNVGGQGGGYTVVENDSSATDAAMERQCSQDMSVAAPGEDPHDTAGGSASDPGTHLAMHYTMDLQMYG